MFKKLYIYILASMFIFMGCEDFLDAENDSLISSGSNLSSETDVQATILGIASLLQNAAYKVVLLNDLRSDMLMTTVNASDELKQINNHVVNIENTLSSPLEFYNIVENCNDFLNNIGEYDSEKYVMDSIRLQKHIGDVSKIRVWAYFQIAKNYNKVYYTETSYGLASDLENSTKDSLLVEYNLDEILPILIEDMLSIKEHGFDWGAIETEYEKFNYYFLSYDMIMGDLYLWAEDYSNAADYFLKLINQERAGNHNYIVDKKYRGNNYSKIFSDDLLEGDVQSEIISSTEFNIMHNQTFILETWFGRSEARGERYMLAPTRHASELFLNETSQWVSVTGDVHRLYNSMYYDTDNFEWAVFKFSYFSGVKFRFPFYRAAELHLKYAEALAYLGRVDVGLALLNGGLKEKYWDNVSAWKPELGIPFRAGLTENIGIRDRVNLEPVEFLTEEQIEEGVVISAADSLRLFEEALIRENALELAFEGKRFETLLRFARRSGNAETLAKPISLGYKEQDMENEIYIKLLDRANWYVKY